MFGFPASPEEYVGSDDQHRRMKKSYAKKREWMDQRGLCVWNGEWGPVYARKQYDGTNTDAINGRRFHVLQDQLAIYNEASLLCSFFESRMLTFCVRRIA